MKRRFWGKALLTVCCVFAAVLLFSSCSVPSLNEGGTASESETRGDNVLNPEEYIDWAYPDYEGYNFTFLTDVSIASNRLVYEGEESEIISDAVDRRNRLIAEKYNLNFAVRQVSDVVSEVRTQVSAGAVDFDIIIAMGKKLAVLAREGHLCNLQTLEKDFYLSSDKKYFDFTDSYWDSNSVEQLTVGGKTYFLNCDLNIGEFGSVIYYNRALVKKYNLKDPAEYVKEGTWTLDNWGKLVTSVGGDLNEDGEMTELDLYGTTYERINNRWFLAGIGERVTSPDERGYAVLDGFDVSRASELYAKLKEVVTGNGWCIEDMPSVNSNDRWEYVRQLFTQDHYLFYCDQMTDWDGTGIIGQFADMESEWGIVPFPKYDTEQENYYSLYPESGALVALPAVMNDGGMTALILEELNYYSSIIVKPSWFDTLLSRKYARDDESEEILDKLYENRVYDMAQFYDFGGIYSKVLEQDVRLNADYVDKYQRAKKAIEGDVKAVYRDFGFEIQN